jgi:DNA helicase HerA-like ATPase
MDGKKDFGVLYGQKTTEDALLIYSSYEDAKASPQTGDFIVLERREGDGDKFLARVEAEIYDEDPIFRSQDKTLIAVNYARIAERDLSERDKQKMFSYTYKVKLLGKFTSDGKDFVTAVRRLPVVSYHARHLTPKEFDNIINGSNENGKEIGCLCIGDDEQLTDKDILFDVSKLEAKRTMVFAQSGFGKTNLVKTLLSSAVRNTQVGKLIFDLEGEYTFKSSKNYGLSNINHQDYRDNLVVFSDKKQSDPRNIVKGGVNINLSQDFSVEDIIHSAIGLTNAGRTFLEYLESLPEQKEVKEFISKIVNNADPTKIRQFAYTKFSNYFSEAKNKKNDDDLEANVSQASKSMLGALIRQIRSFSSVHNQNSLLIEICIKELKNGKTIILDMSLKDNTEASIISTTLVKRLFEKNKQAHTSEQNPIKTVVFVEEAQNVLSEEFVKSNANPFVKLAKQGRKFGIGLVAITQRPSSISEEIRSQAENYFVMHMSNGKDIKALIESNNNYSGVISKFIQSETIAGNLYMISAKQSFVIPSRVHWFEEKIHDYVYDDEKFTEQELPELYK